MHAYLVLSDGTVFLGEGFGYEWESSGEVVFTTGMVGYPETLTDPSFAGQLLCLTYPLQGNYGVPDDSFVDVRWLKKFFESDRIHLRWLLVNNYSPEYNHCEARYSLGDFLKKYHIPAITWIDTRALTQMLREKWSTLGKIGFGTPPSFPQVFEDPNLCHLVAEVSCQKAVVYGRGKTRLCVVDFGLKNNILRELLAYDTTLIRVPHDYPFMDGSIAFDGIILSNWPGDPTYNTKAIANIYQALKKRIPMFGICLWNQLLALAAWAKTYKLKYGHRGQNQPCKDMRTWACVITSQNHWYAVDQTTLPASFVPWFVNMNDQSNEWIIYTKGNIKSVQFHPESSPWPNDTTYLLRDFVQSIQTEKITKKE